MGNFNLTSNKKGDVNFWSVLIGIILVLITFIALAYALGLLNSFFPKQLDKQACENSVALRAAALDYTGTAGSLIKAKIPSIKCKTEEIKIISEDEEAMKKEIAEAMASCWKMLGKGKKDFIGKEWIRKEACVICSTIEFKDKTKTLDNFQQYLAENIVPYSNVSYLAYISNNNNLKADETLNTDIPSSKKYAVIYSIYTDEWLTNVLTGSATATGTGIVIGTLVPGVGTVAGGVLIAAAYFGGDKLQDSWKNFIGISPYYSLYLREYDAQEIASVCTTLEGLP